jgi:hypothetical protein
MLLASCSVSAEQTKSEADTIEPVEATSISEDATVPDPIRIAPARARRCVLTTSSLVAGFVDCSVEASSIDKRDASIGPAELVIVVLARERESLAVRELVPVHLFQPRVEAESHP